MRDLDGLLETAILELLHERGPGKTICPSEAARKVAPEDWRPLMAPARAAAERLLMAGEIEVTQRGKAVNPSEARGAIRLRQK